MATAQSHGNQISMENWSSPFWSPSLLGISMWFSSFCSFFPKSDVTPAGMSSSLVMTTLLVGMSWPWVAALAMGEADMSGKHGGEMAFLRERTAALRTAPPSHHLPLLRCHCVSH